MSYPRYPKYKDSGVEWLSEVPEGWEVMPIKRIALMKSGEQITSDDIEDAGEYPVYGGNGLRGYTSNYTHEGFFSLIGRQGALCGNINYARGKFWTSEHAVVVIPTRQVSVVWLGELLRVMNLGMYSVAAAQPGLAVDTIVRLLVPVPSFEEQQSIVTFLDREIAKIDALIAEQEKLVTLLQEKRQAVISHAVTKGLNPDAPMKDSGVEWLGEVPEGWELKQLKWAILFQRGHDLPLDNRQEGSIPVVSSAGVVDTHSKAMAKGLGIVTGRYGTIGAFHILHGDYWPLNTTLYSIDLRDNNVFFLVFLLSNIVQLMHMYSVKSAVPGIDRNDIHRIMIALPPKEQQQAIVEYLDTETAKIDTLITEANKAIALLKERRVAIISAAVTGKIDVRDIPMQEAV